jgi:hypothetical protein
LFNRYDLNGGIRYSTLNSAGTWSGASPLAVSTPTDHAVAAVTFNGELLVFWREQGSGNQLIRFARRVGSAWESYVSSTGAYAEGGPAVVAFGSTLYLFYVRDGYVRYRTRGTFTSWGAEITPPYQAGLAFGTPDAHVYRYRVHVAVSINDAGTVMPAYMSYCPEGCFYRPNEWTQLVPEHLLWAPTGTSEVSLTSDEGGGNDGRGELLYMFRNTTSGTLYEFKASE